METVYVSSLLPQPYVLGLNMLMHNAIVPFAHGALLNYCLHAAPSLIQVCSTHVIPDLKSHSSHCSRLLAFLRSHSTLSFRLLTDITVLDHPGVKKRFVVVYNLLSTLFCSRITVRTSTDGFLPVVTSASIFYNSNWVERECYDMFGVSFMGH